MSNRDLQESIGKSAHISIKENWTIFADELTTMLAMATLCYATLHSPLEGYINP